MTKYLLPANRTPNAITAAPDGSVWFAEWGVPGVAHLYQNGTLIEYRWPFTYPTSHPTCFDFSDAWGIAIWNGMVWASNADNDQLVGLNPSNDSFQTIQLKGGAFPYTLAVGPDNHLWFSQLSSPAQIGRIDPASHEVAYYSLPMGAKSSSAYLLFQSGTLGYALAIYPSTGMGKVFSFNPMSPAPAFQLVGENSTVGANGSSSSSSSATSVGSAGYGPSTPTSIALGEGGIWLTEHGTSDMAFYDLSTSQWRLYPTSLPRYLDVSLPFFDVSNGSVVWFNEHYSNKLGEICCNRTSLTEYSFSNPPPGNGTQIDNALSIALGQNKVWFNELTANYVGYIDTNYKPPFSVSLKGNSSITIPAGSTARVQIGLSGQSSKALTVQFSDSERFTAVPKNITFTANPGTALSLNGDQLINVTITSAKNTTPGRYDALITVTDGLIYRSVYLNIVVMP